MKPRQLSRGRQLINYMVVSVASLSTVVSCAHYQSRVGGFRGPGEGYSSQGRGALSHASRQHGDFVLSWPVENPQISQEYRPRKNRNHQGIDLRGPKGTKILAAHEGRVIFAGTGFRGYGKMVMIEHGSKWASLYAHLNHINVKQGDYVRLGDVVGGMGRTGRATGVHLHFELLKEKLPIDPLNHLPDTSRIASQN